MLVRLVVVALCVAWATGEFQCFGPGRFSTAPGMCTSEYYTCNRDANKEFVAYVLSCPRNTLFNERTRKCSNVKAVSCVHPSTTTPSGQIKVTTPRRQKVTTQLTSWISRPAYGFKLTTKRHTVEYRKPGRLPWVTPRPHFTTPNPMTTRTKPQKSQWRIRLSTTKRTTLATSSKYPVLPPKIWTQRRTHSPNRRKNTAIPQNVTRKINTIGKINQYSTNFVKVSAVNAPTLTALSRHPNINVTTSSTLQSNPTKSSTLLLSPAVTSTNTYPTSLQTTGILSTPTSSTEKMNPIFNIPSNIKSDKHKTLLAPVYSVISTSPVSVNNIFETTPEVIIKSSNGSIPFMDSFETSEYSPDLEIVDVVFNSSSNFTKHKEPDKDKHNDNSIRYISYFYDPESKFAINRTVKNSENNFKTPYKKDKLKIEQKKRRQPKMDRVGNET